MQKIAVWESPLGTMTMAGTDTALQGLWFLGQKHYGSTLEREYSKGDSPVFETAKQWLSCYFRGEKPDALPPLELRGSEFQKRVWRILLTIPYGKTMTYGQIAAVMEQESAGKVSAQAVGGAVGRNPISILVPCHRVVGRDGSLTGYAAGVPVKAALLRLEGIDMSKLYIPAREHL